MRFFITFAFLSVSFLSNAQKVTNIHAEQRGQDIVVFYTLETAMPCEVGLLVSQDNGVTWSTRLKKFQVTWEEMFSLEKNK